MSGTKPVDVKELTNSKALSVAIVDGSGNQITSIGGTGGTSATDDAAFTPGSGTLTPVGGIVTSDEVNAGDVGAFAMLTNRQQKVTLYDSSGIEVAVGGGTQYTEGNTDATFTGTIAQAEGPSNTATPLQVDASKHLQIDIAADSAGLATAAHQVTQTGHLDGVEGLLATIDGDTGVLAGTVVSGAIQADVLTVPTITIGGTLTVDNDGEFLVQAPPSGGLMGDPYSLVHEGAQYTSQQTSTVLVAGGASEKLVVTKLQIQAFGTTAFDIQVYYGTGAFSRGTSRALFDGRFTPASDFAPGVMLDGPFISGTNGDDLLVTTSAAGSVTVNVWYFTVT